MKTMLKIAGGASLMVMSIGAFAQTNVLNNGPQKMVSKVQDGLYTKENAPNRNPIAWTFLREADVTWQKRIWRLIDLREKMNQSLYFPTARNANRESFWDYITDAMKQKEERRLRVYSVNTFDFDKSFIVELSKGEADTALMYQVPVPDTLTGNTKMSYQDYVSSDILDYLLKEDWYFDRQRSVMDVHILGICPFAKKYQDGSEVPGGKAPMFWIYFPELRPFLSNAEVYNPHNDAERRTYDDIFWKRQFSSYIMQESNVANRAIADYMKDPLDALLEGEKIKDGMFNLEHDMWQY